MSMNPKSVCVHETKRYLNQIATLLYTKMKVAFILNESKVHELYRKVAFFGNLQFQRKTDICLCIFTKAAAHILVLTVS